MESLLNKVVLITGASAGIGGFTAKYLSKYKPKLVLVARSKDRLKQVQQVCEDSGCGKGNVLSITADLAKDDDLTRVVSEAVNAFGQLDVLVNNAGAVTFNDVETTTREAFDYTMAINIRAPFFLSQAAMPHLKKTKGCIVNISSNAAQRGALEFSAYSISKAALDNFTRVLALELAPSGVRVNAIDGGTTFTDTLEESFKPMGKDKLTSLVDSIVQPLGGICSMEDMAKMVAVLSSDLSAGMTGACVPVDRGGLVACPVAPGGGGFASFRNVGAMNFETTQIRMERIAEAMSKGGKPPSSD